MPIRSILCRETPACRTVNANNSSPNFETHAYWMISILFLVLKACPSGHPFSRIIRHAGKRWAYSTVDWLNVITFKPPRLVSHILFQYMFQKIVQIRIQIYIKYSMAHETFHNKICNYEWVKRTNSKTSNTHGSWIRKWLTKYWPRSRIDYRKSTPVYWSFIELRVFICSID